jgi:hypothetical protein
MAIKRENDAAIDLLESYMIKEDDIIECPLVHRFTDGMYIRQIFMPKGSLVTSKIHNTEHPFTVSLGAAAVSIDGEAWDHIVAPYTGITQPGTRRVLYILEDCIWTTYHPIPDMKSEYNNLEDEAIEEIVKGIEDRILEPHINMITGTDINKDYKEILNNNKLLL